MKTTSEELFVIYSFGDTEIHDVYTDKNEAELECVKINDTLKTLTFKFKFKFSVITLYTAIDLIKDYIKLDAELLRD